MMDWGVDGSVEFNSNEDMVKAVFEEVGVSTAAREIEARKQFRALAGLCDTLRDRVYQGREESPSDVFARLWGVTPTNDVEDLTFAINKLMEDPDSDPRLVFEVYLATHRFLKSACQGILNSYYTNMALLMAQQPEGRPS